MRFATLISLSVSMLFPAIVSAQQASQDSTTQSKTAKQLINEAYEAAKSADTFDEYDSIVQLCDAALAKRPGDAGRKYLMQLSAWAYNRRGKELSKQAVESEDAEAANKLEARAMQDFQEAVKRDASRWQAIHNRGVSYALQGDYAKAMADFDRTIELNAKYSNAWFNRGEIHYENRSYDKAIRD